MINLIQPATLNIVLIDDSDLIIARITQLIEIVENVNIVGTASNVYSGFEIVNKEKPNVVILDIQLDKDNPNQNGMMLLTQIKSALPETKVIMLTNHFIDLYKEKCLTNGADYFLDKSNDFDKIPDILNELFDEN